MTRYETGIHEGRRNWLYCGTLPLGKQANRGGRSTVSKMRHCARLAKALSSFSRRQRHREEGGRGTKQKIRTQKQTRPKADKAENHDDGGEERRSTTTTTTRKNTMEKQEKNKNKYKTQNVTSFYWKTNRKKSKVLVRVRMCI